MKKISLFIFLSLLLIAPQAFAALTAATIFEFESGATANNVNGSGFNPAGAHFLTDLAATSANTASPVVTSATYNFNVGNAGSGGDVGAWVYIASGTHWTSTQWCKIASVASNAATLDAAIGHCITSIDKQGGITTNASAGITSDNTATLSAGTGTVDYTQQVTAQISGDTNATQVLASTTLTDTNVTFTPAMVGNLVHITACTGTGCLVGWYEITNYTDSHNVVLDRTATNGTVSITAATIYVGGAGNFGALEDTFQSIIPANAVVWMKNGTYTLSAAISTTNSNNSATNPDWWVGYNSTRGDRPTGSSRPTISQGTNAIAFGGTQAVKNIIFTGSPTTTMLTADSIVNTKVSELTATASVVAVATATVIDSEIISLNGLGQQTNTAPVAFGNYYHDSVNCLKAGSTAPVQAVGNIFSGCDTSAINTGTATTVIGEIFGNTFYGREAKIGTGIIGQSNNRLRIAGNIFYGLTTGINMTAAEYASIDYYNDFFNNTTDVTNWNKSSTSIALDPTFTSVSQLVNTGTVTSATTTLTDTGASFGVTDNVDILHMINITGTGCTANKNYLITGHTSTTLTLNNSPCTTGTAITYYITHNQNFQIGTNLKGRGFPNFTNDTGAATTGYPDTGAVQRQEPVGSGTIGYAAP